MSIEAWVGVGIACVAGAALLWGWFEAGWVRLRTIDVEIPGLSAELDGVRIAHLSDFHLGVPGRGERAVRRGVAWAASRDPDLVCVTGDLVARPAAEPEARRLLNALPRCYAILGNHDVAVSRDPFSRGKPIADLGRATLLVDEVASITIRGETLSIAGLDPAGRGHEADLAPSPAAARLRILLSHFPSVLQRVPDGAYHVVLAGHMHDGQICLPYPGGKLRLAHPSARYTRGLYRRGRTVMHVSPGLGTTFVPFRFFARPEATELTLRATPTIDG